MAVEKKIEQEIGWLKLNYAILFASDISLFVWVFQNQMKITSFVLILSVILAISITYFLFKINVIVYRLLKKLEEND